jgi:hypothetical protein
MTTVPERTSAATTIAGVVATGLTSALALYVIDIPREWQVTLCLAFMVAVGVVVGIVGRPAAWFKVSLALALTAALVFTINSIGLDVAMYWLLGLLMFLPGAIVLSAAALGVTRVIGER